MDETLNKIYPKMFTWLFVGLFITFASGYGLSLAPALAAKVLAIGVIPIIIIELAISILMGFRIKKMSKITAIICYIIFSITTGITFSTLFLAYELTSLMSIFVITSLIFAALAFYGHTTKKDLSKLGIILLISLLVTFVVSLINLFIFKNSTVNVAISAISALVFSLYVAYDMKVVKLLANELDEDKVAVFGAFNLYLDFINLFVRLLELFGKEKD